MKRLPDDTVELLNESGLTWQLRPGKKHYKLVVGGRLAQVIPLNPANGSRPKRRNHDAVMTSLRRLIKELQQ